MTAEIENAIRQIGTTMYLENLTFELMRNNKYVPQLRFCDIDHADIKGHISVIDRANKDDYIIYCAEYMKHDYIVDNKYIYISDAQDLVWFKLRWT